MDGMNMNKKIVIVCVLAVFMLVAISYATAVETENNTKEKESPLFSIRTRTAIGEQMKNIKERIRARFTQNRLFFLLPLASVQSPAIRNLLDSKTSGWYTGCPSFECHC